MRLERQSNFVPRVLIGWCAMIGFALISGPVRSAMAQAVASSQTTVIIPFDPSTVLAPHAPAYSVPKAFSISGPLTLVYTTKRSAAGIASLAVIQAAPKIKLEIKANTTGQPFASILVSLKFTVGGASGTYKLKTPVPVKGGIYTVPDKDLADVLTRLTKDLNNTLAPGFDPAKAPSFSTSIEVDVTPVEKVIKAKKPSVPPTPPVAPAGKPVAPTSEEKPATAEKPVSPVPDEKSAGLKPGTTTTKDAKPAAAAKAASDTYVTSPVVKLKTKLKITRALGLDAPQPKN